MRYRHSKRVVIGWLAFLALAIALFFIIFIGRQRGAVKPQAGFGCEIIKKFSFSDSASLKEWEEKVFKNKVAYRIEKDGELSYVRAVSENAASALYYRKNIDAKNRRPVIFWKWRVEKFPVKSAPESLETEKVDDFAARIYVIFPALFITNSKVLEYVWSESLPVGTTGTSPYSGNIKLIVLQQGLDKDKKWFSEERDIYSDYVKLFGRPPEYNVGAIAFMTNTEHTGSTADAMYDDVGIGYLAATETKGGGKREN
ncbi:MAG: DUF3047 domain-containing protein [Candidatus Omnitrophica bacterium]|nr:DUF3047 domain-containing protein [Candidatus Omnitrophota bacterium]